MVFSPIIIFHENANKEEEGINNHIGERFRKMGPRRVALQHVEVKTFATRFHYGLL